MASVHSCWWCGVRGSGPGADPAEHGPVPAPRAEHGARDALAPAAGRAVPSLLRRVASSLAIPTCPACQDRLAGIAAP